MELFIRNLMANCSLVILLLLYVDASESLDSASNLVEILLEFGQKHIDMEKRMTNLERQNEELKMAVKDQQQQLQFVQSQNWTRSASAFTVSLSHTAYTIPSDGRIIFDKIITNANNDYSPVDGSFRAPFRGRYLFSMSVRHKDRGLIHAYMKKNASVVAKAVGGDYQGWSASGSVSILLDLNRSDAVYVIGDSGKTIQSDATFFTGMLLYPL